MKTFAIFGMNHELATPEKKKETSSPLRYVQKEKNRPDQWRLPRPTAQLFCQLMAPENTNKRKAHQEPVTI